MEVGGLVKWLIIFILVILLIIASIAIYAANFFLNAALFKENSWYDEAGHKMMNPDNFNKETSQYDLTEAEQNRVGALFGKQTLQRIAGWRLILGNCTDVYLSRIREVKSG